MPKEEACTTRNGERAARGVALAIKSSPGAAYVRPQKKRAFCYVSRTEKVILLLRFLARDATSPYRALPPSATMTTTTAAAAAAAVAATTVTVARNEDMNANTYRLSLAGVLIKYRKAPDLRADD
ncbi:hypothetical protein ALC62_11061 [Cyphomyrmex costatus]|uniref:Uncharacterized protein n=1 Tax=Cyphomyrmex costatus TaxID=456900 RepID=A0A151ICS7_9HYME|nr:hypothetical protein ALC62_11061 [Cyphomyrmex costatus]